MNPAIERLIWCALAAGLVALLVLVRRLKAERDEAGAERDGLAMRLEAERAHVGDLLRLVDVQRSVGATLIEAMEEPEDGCADGLPEALATARRVFGQRLADLPKGTTLRLDAKAGERIDEIPEGMILRGQGGRLLAAGDVLTEEDGRPIIEKMDPRVRLFPKDNGMRAERTPEEVAAKVYPGPMEEALRWACAERIRAGRRKLGILEPGAELATLARATIGSGKACDPSAADCGCSPRAVAAGECQVFGPDYRARAGIPTVRRWLDVLHVRIGERMDEGDEAGALDATAVWMAEKDAERLRKEGGA
jgi:hypothetical protein